MRTMDRSQVKSVRWLVMLVGFGLVILIACGPSPDSRGQIEKTANGHIWVLTWATVDSDFGQCNILISESETNSLHGAFLPEPCTAELVANHLEEAKTNAPISAQDWGIELLDQFIAEVRQSE